MTISLTGAADNAPPIAVDDTVLTNEDAPVAIIGAMLTGNDGDPDFDLLAVTAVSNAVGGSVAFNGGNPIFTPDANFNGIAGFDYQVSDGHGGVDTGHVTVTVNAVNDAPDLRPDSPAGVTYAENTAPVQLLRDAVFTDVDNSASFAGAMIGVTLTGFVSGDRFSIYNNLPSGSVQVFFAGGLLHVTVDGTDVGTVSGLGTALMIFHLNANADDHAVEAILKSLVFDTISENPTSAPRIATITLSDGGNTGTGGALSDSVTVPITVIPVNDVPVIVAAGTFATGIVAERSDGSPNENLPPDHSVGGAITFADPDSADTHDVVSVTPQGGGYRGTLTMEPVDQSPGQRSRLDLHGQRQ